MNSYLKRNYKIIINRANKKRYRSFINIFDLDITEIQSLDENSKLEKKRRAIIEKGTE